MESIRIYMPVPYITGTMWYLATVSSHVTFTASLSIPLPDRRKQMVGVYFLANVQILIIFRSTWRSSKPSR